MNAPSDEALVLAFARVLFVNGESSDDVLAAAYNLSRALSVDVAIVPTWDGLFLKADGQLARHVDAVEGSPNGIQMRRVTEAVEVLVDVIAGIVTAAGARDRLARVAVAPPAPTWLFSLAAAAGATALAVIFGLEHVRSGVLIALSGGAGAFLRRQLGRYSGNLFLQPFCAALLAGLVGALAVRFNLSSSLRLVAVCPCMILMPGPHLLNGALDIIKGRVLLGMSRLSFGAATIGVVSLGLLFGLALLGVELPIDEAGRAVPLGFDIAAAGVAVFGFGVFFSMPMRMVAIPIAAGVVAHGLRWFALAQFGANLAMGAFLACLFAGCALAPAARRWNMPFSAIGFAAVVSMIPGVYLFRMAGGLVQLASHQATPELLSATTSDAVTSFSIVVAMSIGLLLPKLLFDRLGDVVARTH